MAHNPKLNVYTLKLNPKSDTVETFRDLFKSKYSLDTMTSDLDTFKKYCESFINGIGVDKFNKDDKNKKVIGTIGSNNPALIPLTPNLNKYTLCGVIEGGKYGIAREYADTNDKSTKTSLDANKAVLDKYYITLYTPLNSKYGFLIVQSYTEESIQDSLKKIITTFFSSEDDFYNIIIEPFVPSSIKEKYAKEAKIKMFSFTNKIPLDNTLRNNVQIQGQTFEVEIKIKPLDYELNPYDDSTREIFNEFGEMEFDSIKLSEGKKKAFVSDTKNRKANYNIDEDIKKIRPTIYLEDVGIIPDSVTGLPNFSQIQDYCKELLEEAITEFNKSDNIHEH